MRYEVKRKLVRMLYDREWDKQKVIDLFAVIDWMMWLPDELKRALRHEIREFEEVNKMRYVTSIEQLGRQEGEAAMLRLMLTHRFGELSIESDARLIDASEDQLRLWGTRLFSAATLDDVFRDITH